MKSFFPKKTTEATSFLPQEPNQERNKTQSSVHQSHRNSSHNNSAHIASKVTDTYVAATSYAHQPRHATFSNSSTTTEPKSYSRKPSMEYSPTKYSPIHRQVEEQSTRRRYTHHERKRNRSPSSEVSNERPNKRPRYNDFTGHKNKGHPCPIKALVANNNFRQAETLLQTIEAPNQRTFQPLLNAYANIANLIAIQRLFDLMKARHVTQGLLMRKI